MRERRREQTARHHGERFGPWERLGRLHERLRELSSGPAILGVGAATAFQHRSERSHVGGDRHQLADTAGQRGHGGLTGEGNLAGDRLDQTQRQRVHVGLRVDVEAQRLFGRGVAGDVGGHGGRVVPRLGAEQLRHREVDDAQPRVLAEHQFRRRDLGVENSSCMGGLERPTRLEAHDQRLRRGEEPAAIEQIAQAATAEVLDHPEQCRLAVEVGLSPAEHRGDVGMVQRHRHFDLPTEGLAERRGHRQLRTNDLHGHRSFRFGVDRLADHGVGTGAHDVLDAVAVAQEATGERAHTGRGRVRCVSIHSGRNATA